MPSPWLYRRVLNPTHSTWQEACAVRAIHCFLSVDSCSLFLFCLRLRLRQRRAPPPSSIRSSPGSRFRGDLPCPRSTSLRFGYAFRSWLEIMLSTHLARSLLLDCSSGRFYWSSSSPLTSAPFTASSGTGFCYCLSLFRGGCFCSSPCFCWRILDLALSLWIVYSYSREALVK